LIRTFVQARRAALLVSALFCVAFAAPASAATHWERTADFAPESELQNCTNGLGQALDGRIAAARTCMGTIKTFSRTGDASTDFGPGIGQRPNDALQAPDGTFYVAMTGQVWKYNAAGGYIETIGDARLGGLPLAVALGPNGHLYVASAAFGTSGTVSEWTTSGAFVNSWTGFGRTRGIAVNQDNGHIFVAEGAQGVMPSGVRELDASGNEVRFIPVNNTASVAVDPASGRFFVADEIRSLYVFGPDGTQQHKLDTGGGWYLDMVWQGGELFGTKGTELDRWKLVPNEAPNTPGAPAGPAHSRTGDYAVSWAAATPPDNGGDAVAYTLERSSDGGNDWDPVASGLSATSHAVTGTGDGDWIYRVKAVDGEGAPSPWAVGGATRVNRNDAPTAGGAPDPGVSSPTNSTPLQFDWTAGDDDDLDDPLAGEKLTYTLEKRDADDSDWSTVGSTTGTTLQDDPVDGRWRYQVRVTDTFGESALSPETAIVVDTEAPAGPTLSVAPGQTAVDGWYRESVAVDVAPGADADLDDGSAGSGVAALAPAQEVVTAEGATTVTRANSDRAGNGPVSSSLDVKVDASAPQVDVQCPAAEILIGSSAPDIAVSATDTWSGVDPAHDPSGSYPVATDTVGVHTRSFRAQDRVGYEAESVPCSWKVVWPFAGFYSPVNMDKVNVVKAGSAVPVKFSLGGDRGIAVLDGAPDSVRIATLAGTPTEVIEDTVPLDTPTLTYDATSDRYQFVWKTKKEWAGSSRRLKLKLADGTVRTVDFQFK
jgi:hypothetical protein